MASIQPAPAVRGAWPFMSPPVDHLPQLSPGGLPVPSRQEVEFPDGHRIWLRRVTVDGYPHEWLRELGAPAEGMRIDLSQCVHVGTLAREGAHARDVANWISQQLRTRFATRDAFLEFAVKGGRGCST